LLIAEYLGRRAIILRLKYAEQTRRYLYDVCVDCHQPTWYQAWGVETMWRNEYPFAFPSISAEIFAAKALILHEWSKI
jgi:hypothetical protein